MDERPANPEFTTGHLVEIRGHLVARNTLLNVAGQVIPLLFGVAAIPYIVHKLGTSEFGILSLAWVLLGYVGLFDLGLGRATTKFFAEYLAGGRLDELDGLFWTSTGFQLILGLVGGVLGFAVTPLLVHRVLNIPASLVGEAQVSFFILAASTPAVLITNSLRGILEAAQRFDLVNYVKVPSNISVFLLPVAALPLGVHLPGIVLLLVIARVGALAAYFVLCLKIFPVLRKRPRLDKRLGGPLGAFAGWVTVSNVLGALLIYLDRFFIGALLSVAELAYYAAPCEAINRLSFIPGSLASTLFPAFSSLGVSEAQRDGLARLYTRSLKYLLLVLGPLLALVAAFAPLLLRVWLGPDFALKSTLVLRLLAVAVLVNALAFVPFSLVQGLGRPDLTAKLYLVEVPVYAILLWLLVGRFGIAGAALAWILRAILDATVLIVAVCVLKFIPSRSLKEYGLPRSLAGVLLFTSAVTLACLAERNPVIQSVVVGLLVVIFAVVAWGLVLDSADRRFLTAAAAEVFASFRRVHDNG